MLELGGGVNPDAGVEALGQNHTIGERGAEPRRHREPILRIETVLVETPKSHLGESFLSGSGRAGKELGPE
jgi:hypothetical protein